MHTTLGLAPDARSVTGFASRRGTHHARLFIADGSAELIRILQSLFEDLGNLEVAGHAGNAPSASQWLALNAGRWNVASIDPMMGAGAGLDLIARFRAASPNGVIVAFTDSVSPALAALATQSGADAVFSKSRPGAFADYVGTIAEQVRLGFRGRCVA